MISTPPALSRPRRTDESGSIVAASYLTGSRKKENDHDSNRSISTRGRVGVGGIGSVQSYGQDDNKVDNGLKAGYGRGGQGANFVSVHARGRGRGMLWVPQSSKG